MCDLLAGVTYTLTVRQPWADLIVAGVKDVENRTWRPPSTLPHHFACAECGVRQEHDADGWARAGCDHSQMIELVRDGPFPFTVAIHAASSVEPRAEWAWQEHALTPWRREWVWRKGAIVGVATITGCHHANECVEHVASNRGLTRSMLPRWCSRWAEPDRWHWTIADAQALDEPIPARGRLGLWRLAEAVGS